MILPVAKLGALLMKTLGKPLAARLKAEAARHPRFRQIIIDFAQSNHRFQVNIQRRIYGHDTGVVIHPLNPEKAVQAASDLLGECIIFAVAGTIVILEVQRSSRSEAQKEAKMMVELEALRQKDACLLQEVEIVRCRLEELERNVKRGQVHQKANNMGAVHNGEIKDINSHKVLPPTCSTQTSEKLP